MSFKRKRTNDENEYEEPDGEPEEMVWSDDEGTEFDGIYIPPPAKHYSSNNSNTRIIITKITNNFFKSYGENVTLGPFTKCFNAIIGPNGSGKSNVIDSVLFVFGYRATKIRCKKTSVLIHNSSKYRNIQSCTVSVHFCEIVDKPGRDYEIIPESEFVVSRTASRDNSSYYELNQRRVQFKEIAKLLRNHGIDLDHNRFLILQGEVEEIAMMKCKGANENETGMLEYLEDIIGTNRYKKPLAQFSEEIEALSVLRLEKQNRLDLIKKELEHLEEPMQEAMDFLRKENKIAVCKNIIYQKNIYDLEEKIETIEEDRKKISEASEVLTNQLKAIAEKKAEKDRALKQESAKYDKLVQRRDQLKEAYNIADKRDVELQADMTQINNNRKKKKEQLAEERKKLSQLERVPEKNKEAIAEYEAKENELTTKKSQLEEEKTKLLASLRSETKDVQIQKEKLERELGQLKKKVDSTKSNLDVAESELSIAQSREQKEKTKFEELKKSVAEAETTLKERTEQVAKLKKKIPLTEKSLNGALTEIQQIRNQEAQINEEIKRKRFNLEETRSSMQKSKSRGAVLDSLMQQKREGKCSGLYGRLGDLGAIDEKYDVAVSTACGPLDNIVVDTVDTAEWCINYLKVHGIGRATFIALEKQEHLRQLANSKIKTPEHVHRLFDLIKVQDEIVKTAFYFALRDTLVANDLDQATRIAFGAQRFRVVTVNGELIETTGTMSGGGSVSRGRMGRSVVTNTISPQEIEKMENNLRKLEDQLKNMMQKQNLLESQINTLQPELNQMKVDYEKFSRELESLQKQLPSLVEQLRKQEHVSKSTKSDPEQVKKLTKIVNTTKSQFEEASAAAQEVQVEVDKLTKIIKEKTTNKMKAMDQNINEVAKTIDKCKADITKLRVAITTAERNTKKSVQKIATLEQDIIDAENSLRQMKAERETIEADGQKLLKCIEEITEQLSVGEEYADLKREVVELNEEENKLKLKQVDVQQTFRTIKEKMNESKALMHQWNVKLNQLKLHDIPEEAAELKKYSLEEINSINMEVTELELQTNQNNVKNMKPNLNIIQEYRDGQKVFFQRMNELESVTKKQNNMKDMHDKVKNRRKDEFLVGYNIIRRKLKEMYQMITLGGDADFEIVDSFDPFAEGIQFNVRPPKKSWKNISNLSGGEKTLSSLSLVFALHYYKPSPLYVMDEIDAALDFKNVSIVANYIKERTKNTQFIIISLRSNMFELADNLVGIYKIDNCTQTLTIDPNGFDEEDDEVVPEVPGQNNDDHVNKEVRKSPYPKTNTSGNMEMDVTATDAESGDNSSIVPAIYSLFD